MGSERGEHGYTWASHGAGATQRLVRAPVPAIALIVAIVIFVLFGGHQPSYYLFFLPVALAGVGLGARRGLIAAAASILVVAAYGAVTGKAYLTGDAVIPLEAVGSAILWAALLTLTGYTIGLASERGGSRAVGRDFGAEIMSAVEREHLRIGFDLHDTLAQNAASSLMEAEILTSMLSDAEPQVRQQAQRLRDSVDNSIDQIRAMIAHLRPPSLARGGFPDTLHALVDSFAKRTGIKVEYSLEGALDRHSDSMRICVYRVVQEALSNCERHASASRVFVSLRCTRNMVFLLIADDGVGFNLSDHEGEDPLGHYGLQSMRERVSLLGGVLEIETSPSRGTGIRAQIPAL
ncbi:MAG: sensor histidine kinase [Thermoleophilia bacterium]